MAKQTYSFRLKREIRDKLLEEALAEHRSATNMLEWILQERYKDPDEPTQLEIEQHEGE